MTRAGFDVVLRLIGHAQSGREPSAGIASEPGPLPRFEGISVPGQPAAAPAPAPISPLQAQGTGGGPIRVPPLLPEKGAQYAALFESLPLQPGGVLPGLQAKQVFEKSGLPNDVLGRIWQLADTEQRGSLVQTEFIIAMHLLTVFKTGQLRAYPTVIPASLYETATRAVSARSAAGAPGVAASPVALTANTTGSAGAPTSPGFGIPRQLTGQAVAAQHQLRTGSPLSRPRPVAPQSTGGSVGAGAGDWLVTQADKARFDQLFDQVDTGRKGFITGEEAVEFFGKSKLPEDVLAQIWDLADMRSEGRLDRDAFAIAMYLIRQQRTPGAAPLPSVLPPALVPPSMRVAAPAPAARPPTATEPPKPAPSSFFDDLLSLDASPPASAAASLPPALAQTALSTGGSTGGGSTAPAGVSDPFTAASPAPPQSGSTTFKPFMPSSAFGRSLAAAPDSAKSTPPPRSQQAAPGAKPQPASTAQDDLLTDTDPEISKRLNNDTVELANLSNQITSLSKQMQDVSAQRTTSQNELGQASAQKKNFEARLAQLRAAYEKEAMDVRALQEQLTASRNEIKKLQTDMALVEATYQDLNTQKQQILTALQADQQENAALKEKIRVANGEIAQLRPQIEKLKSEARHQKGLVAISKKQLATTESERDKMKAEADELTKTNEELARQINSGSPDAARQINSASPASTASGAQSTTTAASNPFFRRTPSTDVAGAFSPAAGARPFDSKAFEDVFGPSVPATSTPPPPTTFRQQDTGTSTASAASFATPTSSTAANTVRQQPGFAVEPPSQPESRQITSSSLPLGDVSESLSTSRQVSPPESRVGSSSTPAVEAPSSAVSSPFAADESSKATLAPAADIKPNGTTPAAPTEAPPASSGSDPFSTAPAAAKVDFDSMFAGYAASSSKSTDKGAKDASQQPWTNFNKEFPPIAELDRDDDSDSDSDKGGVGFDDDFAPASPPTRPPPPKTEPSSKEEASSPTVTQSPPAPSVDAAAAVGGSSL